MNLVGTVAAEDAVIAVAAEDWSRLGIAEIAEEIVAVAKIGDSIDHSMISHYIIGGSTCIGDIAYHPTEVVQYKGTLRRVDSIGAVGDDATDEQSAGFVVDRHRKIVRI